MLGSVGHIKTILRTARISLRRQSNEGIIVLLEAKLEVNFLILQMSGQVYMTDHFWCIASDIFGFKKQKP